MSKLALAATALTLATVGGAASAATSQAAPSQAAPELPTPALARHVVTTGACVGGATYRLVMRNDSDGTGVVIVFTISGAAPKSTWGGGYESSWKTRHGKRGLAADGQWTSDRKGTIVVRQSLPAQFWHETSIDLIRRGSAGSYCSAQLRA